MADAWLGFRAARGPTSTRHRACRVLSSLFTRAVRPPKRCARGFWECGAEPQRNAVMEADGALGHLEVLRRPLSSPALATRQSSGRDSNAARGAPVSAAMGRISGSRGLRPPMVRARPVQSAAPPQPDAGGPPTIGVSFGCLDTWRRSSADMGRDTAARSRVTAYPTQWAVGAGLGNGVLAKVPMTPAN